jgi:hypothetical protein
MCQNNYNQTNPSTPLESWPAHAHWSSSTPHPSVRPSDRHTRRRRSSDSDGYGASLHHRWRSTGLVSAPELPPVVILSVCLVCLPRKGYAEFTSFCQISQFSYARNHGIRMKFIITTKVSSESRRMNDRENHAEFFFLIGILETPAELRAPILDPQLKV